MKLAAGIDLGGTRVKGIAHDLELEEELERTILSTNDGKFFDEDPSWANAIRVSRQMGQVRLALVLRLGPMAQCE